MVNPAVPAALPEEPPAPATYVMSVADLSRRLKRLVEGLSMDTWVEGEVASFKAASSGHLYFSLKDEHEDASIDCVMYRLAALRARRLLEDGARVQIRGRATFWLPRGRLQFVIEAVREVGRGALLEALEALKAKLAAEGLFALERKRPLPKDPRVIGVVTSPAGAAIHDIIKVAFRRGHAHILLAPARVQGVEAPGQIIAAIDQLEQVAGVDVIIVGRGGGAADDLAAFQDERVVRRIARCRVPVLSAVGHEIDITLTDLAADARAATPSQAAELLVPDATERARMVHDLRLHLARSMRARISEDALVLERLNRQIGDPRTLLGERQQQLDDWQGRMRDVMRTTLSSHQNASLRLQARLSAHHPRTRLSNAVGLLRPMELRLKTAMRKKMAAQRAITNQINAQLDALSPLAVLARGYAIALNATGHALVHAEDTNLGDTITVRLHQGSLQAQVLSASGPVAPANSIAPPKPSAPLEGSAPCVAPPAAEQSTASTPRPRALRSRKNE